MADISIETYTFQKRTGLFFKSGTHQEALQFVRAMVPGVEHDSGWIKTEYGMTNIRAGDDGLGAVCTNGVFDEGDQSYFYTLVGKEATDILLRHHSIRKR